MLLIRVSHSYKTVNRFFHLTHVHSLLIGMHRSTRRHYKAIHLKVISYFRERYVRGEFAQKSHQ